MMVGMVSKVAVKEGEGGGETTARRMLPLVATHEATYVVPIISY